MSNTLFGGIALCTVSNKYLNSSRLVALNIVDSKNKNGSDWCDLEISLPLFFNFYHGLEVMIKAFSPVSFLELNKNHKLSVYLDEANGNHSLMQRTKGQDRAKRRGGSKEAMFAFLC